MIWTTRQRSRLGTLAGIVAGEGPRILLIHGVGLRAEAWNAQIDALAQNYSVIAVDMPGHGESAPLAHAPGLAEYTDCIASATDGPVVVIGHSFGAMIALDMAIRYPDQVKGVAALNAIYRRDAAAQATVKARADSLDGRTMADPAGTLERWFGSDLSAERDACDDWLRTVDPAGYRDTYSVFASEDGPAEAELRALKCPALFLTGSEEPNSTPRMSEDMATLVPSGRAVSLAGAAHMLPMTHAAQVNAILTDFVGDLF